MASAITDVRVWLNKNYKKGDNYLGSASITINEDFVVKGIRILAGNKGPFISLPAVKGKNGYSDICFPITKEARAEIVNAIMAEAKRAKENGGVSPKQEEIQKDFSVTSIPF